MWKRHACSTAALAALTWPIASQAQSSPPPADQPIQRIEVTGSAIKRIDTETALPVTVIKADDLKASGITSVEQAVATLSVSQASISTSQVVGTASGGAAFADMRGLGQNKTLVLLNGRRIANNAIDGAAPDLNMIPFAALDRIEVLRDGASSLYGTDAIGGVINFITRSSLTGGSITLGAEVPEQSGGKSYNANVAFGFGDLNTQGFNILGVFDFSKQRRIAATQRAFGSTGNIPSLGISKSSGAPDPANYTQGDNIANPAGPACDSDPSLFAGDAGTCRFDYTRFIDLMPEVERVSGFLKGTLNINDDHRASVEYFITRATIENVIAPVPYFGLEVAPGTAYFPGNGITPAPTDWTIDPGESVYANWRAVPAGGREGKDINTQQRLLGTLDGYVGGWDYSVGAAYNENKITGKLTGGYTNDTLINDGALNGLFNPFGPQTADTAAYIDSTLVSGTLRTSKGQTWSLDSHASREVGDWFGAGKQVALAVGAEARHEKFSDKANVDFASLVVSSTGFDPNIDSRGSRSVYAVFAELEMPITPILDVTAAIRDDHYSDFGNTINPKVSFRLQPIDQVLLRGSFSTGFRAPSLYELNAATTYTNTANSWNDPLLCPGGTAVPGESPANVCDTQFFLQQGGNQDLEPEKSKSWSLGAVFEPVRETSVAVDFWWVRLKHSINAIPEELIFGDPAGYAALYVRDSTGHLSISGQDCPGTDCGYIANLNQNLGGTNANGIDLAVNSRVFKGGFGTFDVALNGTYVAKYEYQQTEGGQWLQNAGRYSGAGPILRWQHTLAGAWNYDMWTVGLVNRFKSGYTDQNDPNQVDADKLGHRVGSYSLWDLYGTWTWNKQVSLTAGVRNLFDRDPPASNQGATFQQGYDPRYTDPTGRAYYVRATYNF